MENNKIETPSGLKYTVDKLGEGEKLGAGKKARVHYTGTLTDGSVFDSSITRGQPFEFMVGAGQVIKGWDEAIADMKKGEKRTLEIPPNLAYGNNGHRLSGQTLVFKVELLGE